MREGSDCPSLLRVGAYELDFEAEQVRKRGRVCRLRPQAFQLLKLLILRGGKLVTRQDIIEGLWPNVKVDFDRSINLLMVEIREVLSDNAKNPHYIETVPKRGYRFIYPISPQDWSSSSSLHPLSDLAGIPKPILDNGVEKKSGVVPPIAVEPVRWLSECIRQPENNQEKEQGPAPFDQIEDQGQRQPGQPAVVPLKARRRLWGESNSKRGLTATLTITVILMATLGMLFLRWPRGSDSTAHVDNQVIELCQNGLYEWNKRTEEGLEQAKTYFAKAVSLNSEYAPAHAGLALVYAVLPYYSESSPNDTFPTAKNEAEKAIQLDPTLPEPHVVLGLINCTYFNIDVGEREYRKALQLNPSYATAHHWYSFCLYQMNRRKEAIEELERAHRLDVNSLIIETDKARMLTADHQTDAAIDLLSKVIQMERGFAEAHRALAVAYVQKREMALAVKEALEAVSLDDKNNSAQATLGYVYAVAGDSENAKKKLAELTKSDRAPAVPPVYLSFIYIGLQQKNDALDSLERASRDNSLLNTADGPEAIFDSMRSDPRFTVLLRGNAERVQRSFHSWTLNGS